MTEPKQHCCLNCNAVTQGAWCHQCGQKSDVKTITVLQTVMDTTKELTDVKGPMLRTLIGLVKEPGKLCLNYVNGSRKQYANPVKYFIISYALMLLALKLSDWMGGSIRLVTLDLLPIDDGLSSTLQKTITESIQYAALVQGLLIPFQAMTLRLFFRSFQRRYAEYIILLIYVIATTANGFSLLVLTRLALIDAAVLVYAAVMMIYMFWACIQFTQASFVSGFLRCMGAFSLYSVLLFSVVLVLLKVFG
ncbi:MAG: hypothetical protein ACI8WB_005278 [Phenylobacterium sp.]|jgi:hypothetical protein